MVCHAISSRNSVSDQPVPLIKNHGKLIQVLSLLFILPAANQASAQAFVEVFINGRGPHGENDLTDDYVTWSPTLCEMRVLGHPAGVGPYVVHVSNDPAVDEIVPASPPVAIPAQGTPNPPRYAGGRVCFAEEPASWPADTTATQQSIQLELPRNGDFVKFRIAGQFGRPSFHDKDVILQVRENDENGPIVGYHRLMVRVRKNGNRMHDFEIKRFLDAMRAYKDRVGGRSFDENAEIHRQSFSGGDEAHGQPSFLPWHRAYLLQVERDLQSIDNGAYRAATIPYWNWDEATPRLWTDWYLGAPDSSRFGFASEVEFHSDNPLDAWLTPLGDRIIRRTAGEFDPAARPPIFQTQLGAVYVPSLKPDPLATPSLLSQENYGRSSAGSIMRLALEDDIHNEAHSLNCGGGQLRGGNSADDPAFYFLHCQIDREWAAWQNYRNRFGGQAEDYDLDDGNSYAPGVSTEQFGSHLHDEIWPWDLSGGVDVDPLKTRPQSLGGKFEKSPIRNLWPPSDSKPTNRDLIDYQGRSNPALGLGFCYDDVPFGRGPSIGAAKESALFRVSVANSQTVGSAFQVDVEAIDADGNVRTNFQGHVVLVQEDATIGSETLDSSGVTIKAGVHIDGTATTDDDFHDFVAADAGVHSFSVVAHTAETIPRFKAFALEGGIPGESGPVTVAP